MEDSIQKLFFQEKVPACIQTALLALRPTRLDEGRVQMLVVHHVCAQDDVERHRSEVCWHLLGPVVRLHLHGALATHKGDDKNMNKKKMSKGQDKDKDTNNFMNKNDRKARTRKGIRTRTLTATIT